MDYIEVPLQLSEPPFESAVESLRNRCGVQYYSVVYDISFVAVILRLPFREVASLKLHRSSCLLLAIEYIRWDLRSPG